MKPVILALGLALSGCIPQGADLEPPDMLVRMQTAPGQSRVVLSTYRAAPGIASVCAGGAIPDAIKGANPPIVLMPPRQTQVRLSIAYADLAGLGASDVLFSLSQARGAAEGVTPGIPTLGFFRMPETNSGEAFTRDLVIAPRPETGVTIRLEAADLAGNERVVEFRLARHSDYCE